VYARRNLSGIKPVLLATGQMLVAAAFILVAAFLFEDAGRQRFTWPAALSVLWLGLLGSCLAYILYFFVLQEWGATRTTLVTYLIPVVGVAAGVLFLDERLDWQAIMGALLILSGVGLVNWRPGHRRPGLSQQ
jgi:drug/metabolite transporter (DMT)-like permease